MVRGLLASTLGFLGGRLVQPVFTFFLFFISARLLTVGQFGQYVLLMGLIVLFQSLASLGLGAVLAREIGRRPREEGPLIGAALLLSLPASLAGASLLPLLGWGLTGSGEFAALAAILALSLPLSSLVQFGESVFAAHDAGLHLFRVGLAEQALRVGLSLGGLVLGFGVYGLVTAYVIGRFLAASGVTFIFFRRKMSPPLAVSRAALADLGRRLATFAPMNFLANLYFRADVIVLAWLMGDEALGLYGCAMRLVGTTFLGPESVVTASFPRVSRAWAAREAGFGDRVLATMELLLAVGFSGAAGLAVFAGFLLTPIFGAKYAASGPILAFLGFMLPAHGLNVQLGLLLMAANREAAALRLTALGTAMVFAFTALGVLRGGVSGAAWGTLAATWAMALLHLLVTARLGIFDPRRRPSPLVPLAVTAGALFAAGSWRPADDTMFSLACAAAAVSPLAFGGLLQALRPSRIKRTLS